MKDLVKERLIQWEALVLKPYECSQGYTTIGVGRNLETNGISKDEAMYLLNNDINSVIQKLDKQWPVWNTFPENAKTIIIDLVFNMGINTWLSFRKTRAYMELGEWEKAGKELLNSKYAQQVGRRAIFNSEELKKCQLKVQTNIKTILE
jgi:lysozyme